MLYIPHLFEHTFKCFFVTLIKKQVFDQNGAHMRATDITIPRFCSKFRPGPFWARLGYQISKRKFEHYFGCAKKCRMHIYIYICISANVPPKAHCGVYEP